MKRTKVLDSEFLYEVFYAWYCLCTIQSMNDLVKSGCLNWRLKHNVIPEYRL